MEQHIDARGLKNRLGFGSDGRVQRAFTSECERHMQKYVPFQNGPLRSQVDIQKDYIEYQSPYARFQYHGKLMVGDNGSSYVRYGEKKHVTNIKLNYHTLGTGAYWDKIMWSAEGKQIISDIEGMIRNGTI